MLNFDKLMTLVENSTAMNEQYEDAYPEMSMLEAAAYLPTMITESQLELAESVNEQTEKVMDIMTESADRQGDLEALTEASLQGIKDRILGFLKKVKEVVMSIINKIGQAISMMVKSNKDLVAKYGNKINEDKCRDLTITAYPAGVEAFKPHLDAKGFMDQYSPKNIPDDMMKMQDFVNQYKEADKAALKAEMVTALTGKDLTSADSNNWGKEYLAQILGEKKEIKYGEGMFTYSDVKDIMTNTKMLSDCKDQYNKILKDASMKEKDIQKLKADTKGAEADAKRESENDRGATMTQLTYNCYTIWLARYQAAYNCVSQAKNVEVKAVQIMQQQAKAMFGKMLKASTGKGSEG